MVRLIRLMRKRRGQAVVEYAMMLGIVAFGLIMTLLSFQSPVQRLWEYIVNGVIDATTF